jgi:uncharacterized protein YegL
MSIETLNSAARAAGFAMAADEPAEETKKTQENPGGGWRPGEAILLNQADPTDATARVASSFTDRLKGALGALGLRATA